MFEALRKAACATFDLHDVTLLVGLGLLSFGLAQVWAPAAYIAPGLVLTYVALVSVRSPGGQDGNEAD